MAKHNNLASLTYHNFESSNGSTVDLSHAHIYEYMGTTIVRQLGNSLQLLLDNKHSHDAYVGFMEITCSYKYLYVNSNWLLIHASASVLSVLQTAYTEQYK